MSLEWNNHSHFGLENLCWLFGVVVHNHSSGRKIGTSQGSNHVASTARGTHPCFFFSRGIDEIRISTDLVDWQPLVKVSKSHLK